MSTYLIFTMVVLLVCVGVTLGASWGEPCTISDDCTDPRTLCKRRPKPKVCDCLPGYSREGGVCVIPVSVCAARPNTIGDVMEAPAGTGIKYDLPWCPSEQWIIFGRTDGCMAVANVSWYLCTQEFCQGCKQTQKKTLACIPDKFTQLIIPLTCSGGSTSTMEVWRPMACACHKVKSVPTTTCKRFTGNCCGRRSG